MEVKRYVSNGWWICASENGDLRIGRVVVGGGNSVAVSITKDGIEVHDPVLGPKALRDSLVALLLEPASELHRHRRDRMAMWEKLFVKFANTDGDAQAYWDSKMADEYLKAWESKRQEMGLPFIDDERAS